MDGHPEADQLARVAKEIATYSHDWEVVRQGWLRSRNLARGRVKVVLSLQTAGKDTVLPSVSDQEYAMASTLVPSMTWRGGVEGHG